MRSINMVEPFCDTFAEVWSNKYQDLNFSQFVLNFLGWHWEKYGDPSSVENDTMGKRLREYENEYRNER